MSYGEGSKGALIDILNPDTDLESEITLVGLDQNIVVKIREISDLVSKYIIKIYFDEKNFLSESKIVKELINIGVVEDYITYKDNKYYAIYNGKKYGMLKIKCRNTLENYKIESKLDDGVPLKQMCKDILKEIFILQMNNYTHCDIKADNIMMCDGKFKLIDWDLCVHTPSYDKHTVCKNRYIGSATHTSKMLELSLYKFCGKRVDKYKQSIKRIASKTLKRRNISFDVNNISSLAQIHFLENNSTSIVSLYNFHIDLYSFSVTIYEILDVSLSSSLISKFIYILQNTVNVQFNDVNSYDVVLNYLDESFYQTDKLKSISFTDLLNLIPENWTLTE